MDMNEEKIIEAIKSGKAKMRPRSYFITQAILALLGAVLLFIIIFFITTFIIFALQENGGLFAARFGPAGWGVFFTSLPWAMLLLSLALVLILWLLLRRYALVYHQPVLYIILILVVAISLASLFVSAGSIHGGIYRYVSANPVPVFSGVYALETAPAEGIYRGQVVAISTSSLLLADELGQTSTILFAPAAPAPLAELRDIEPGDYVIVFGRAVAPATIAASGAEKIVDYR